MSNFVRVITRRERPWPHPRNHMDRRVCPDCGATAHGWDGQRTHDRHHEKEKVKAAALAELVTELAKRCGMAEEQVELLVDQWQWGAEVTGDEDAIEGEGAAESG
jgi:hypothetical protein